MTNLSQFRLLRRIASGASATVFEAVNLDRGDHVALKLFLPQFSDSAPKLQRIQREVEALRRVHHGNVCKIHSAGQSDGQFYLELELVSGLTLREWMALPQDRKAPLIEPRLWILLQIARALGAIHEESFVHRDLKPENILLTATGWVKVADFGLARPDQTEQILTQTGQFIGSLSYMSPEALSGGEVTRASDLFSFGILAYELLLDQHPFHGENVQSVIKAILEKPPSHYFKQNPLIPSAVAEIIHLCLEKDAGKRPASICNIEAVLMTALQDSAVLAQAKVLAASDHIDAAVLAEALRRKYAKLKKSLEARLHEGVRPHDRGMLHDLNEFRHLFPNDPELTRFLHALTPATRPLWVKRAALVAASVVTAFSLGLFVWGKIAEMQGSREKPRDASTPPVVSASSVPVELPPALPLPLPHPPETHQSLRPRRHEKAAHIMKHAPEKTRGTIRILVEPDVKVYVDGQRLSASQFEAYALPVGPHLILLEKEGFASIEKVIQVKAHGIATINAKGSKP